MKFTLRMLLDHRLSLPISLLCAAFLTIASIAGSQAGIGWVKPLVTVDGTYQTFAMLNRLSDGNLPGRDNVPYLGVIMCYALAPIFFLMGKTIFAAFAAAQLAVLLAWFGTCTALLWAVDFSRRQALSMGAAFFSVLFVVSAATGIAMTSYRAGQSMILLRESSGLILALAMLCMHSDARRRVVIAVGSGILLFWSPSSGVATLLAGLGIIGLGLFKQHGLRRGLLALSGYAGVAIMSALATATILSAGAPLWLIQKVFLNASQTQFWFFAGFGGDDRLLNLRDAVSMFAPSVGQGVTRIFLVAAVVYAYLRAGIGSRHADAIGLICGAQLLSGLATQAAGHFSPYYLDCFNYSALIVVLGLVLPWILRLHLSKKAGLAGLGMIAIGAVAAGLFLTMSTRGQKIHKAIQARLDPASQYYFAEAGMDFPANTSGEVAFLRGQRAAMDKAGIPADRRMMSAYYSWADVAVGAAQQTHFNSVIQLMSDADRDEFTQHLISHNPELVSTLDPASTAWALWNLRASWSFYRAALIGHEPTWRGSSMLYWQRRPAPLAPRTDNLPTCTIARQSPTTVGIQVAGGAVGAPPVLLDVAISYSANPGPPGLNGDLGRGYLRVTDRSPVLRATMAALQATGTPISDELAANGGFKYGLPAGNKQLSIPVEFQSGSAAPLQFELQGGAKAKLDITSCRVLGALPDPFPQIDRLPKLAPTAKP